MKRKKLSLFIFCVNSVLFGFCGGVDSTPAQNLHTNNVVNKFQGVLQQQNFFSILTSIEERLRNLDNIYSMQLSQTLETKLDQYSRRLDALDTKIIRLEALVMLNLDKISENISTKNFKDDITKTNTFRKIDSIYEGIGHRLNYMDRKYDTNFAKIQTKMDTAISRLEKIEEGMATRDSDIEAELSDAIFAIDDLKTTYTVMEGKLQNITSTTYNLTKDNFQLFKEITVENRRAANKLHDNIIESLQYIDNKTSAHFRTILETNAMVKAMKADLKQDFNDYANKVADMNSYIWKNSDSTDDDLKTIAIVVNSTKTEVQNSMRSLMVQIGKLSTKDNNIPTGTNPLEELNKNVNSNFDKILKNQDLFLESCHRLQMDEAQIETEISAMLEKLIDMLENKLALEILDIKNLEKALKNHDGRINRNVFQVNANIISFFERAMMHNQDLINEVKKISNDSDALFYLIQGVITDSGPSSFTINNIKVILEKLNKVEHLLTSNKRTDINSHSEQDISQQIQNLSNLLQSIDALLNNSTFLHELPKYSNGNCSTLTSKTNHTETTSNRTEEIQIDEDTQKLILDIFGPNPNISNDSKEIKIDEDTQKLIPEIFGSNTNSLNANLKLPEENNNKKNKCKQNYRNFIDVRSGIGEKCGDSKAKTKKVKTTKVKRKKKRPYQIDVRGDFLSGKDEEYEDSEENAENTMNNMETVDIDTTTEMSETTTNINEDEDIISNFSGIQPNNTNN